MISIKAQKNRSENFEILFQFIRHTECYSSISDMRVDGDAFFVSSRVNRRFLAL